MFPFFDRGAAESPCAANPEAGNQTAPEQAVNRGRMNSQMIGELGYREDLLIRRHKVISHPPGQSDFVVAK